MAGRSGRGNAGDVKTSTSNEKWPKVIPQKMETTGRFLKRNHKSTLLGEDISDCSIEEELERTKEKV